MSLALTAAASLFGSPPAGADPAPDRLRKIVFTVNAYSRMGDDARSDPRWKLNVGTAFPVGEGGYLMTLSCVLKDAERVQVTDGDGGRFDASLVGYDETGGISILKIAGNDGAPAPRIRSVRAVKPGARVVFVGVPAGGAMSSTPGTVDALYDDGTMIVAVEGEPGTSGTPVFDEEGQAIGLLAYHIEPERAEGTRRGGSYLVFPMEYATLMARSIINRVEGRSGWLGITASMNGLTVRDVAAGSPAEKSGIQPGDRVVELNGEALRSPADLVRAIGATRAGETVRVKVIRQGESLTITPRLSGFPAPGRR